MKILLTLFIVLLFNLSEGQILRSTISAFSPSNGLITSEKSQLIHGSAKIRPSEAKSDSQNKSIPIFFIEPNPASQFINLHLRDFHFYISTISIVDISGRNILQNQNEELSTTFQIDIRDLDPGIYILTIITNNGIISSRKLIRD